MVMIIHQKTTLNICYFNLNGITKQRVTAVDPVPSSGRETLQLLEDAHSVSCGLDHISLRQDTLSKCLKGSTACQHNYKRR